MSISNKLPSVLTSISPQISSISMERALNQVLTILTSIPSNAVSDSLEDKIQASIHDVEQMISSIER